ncbi:MAG TPA: hypothetical protein VK507_04585, partial [Iamia sp.]|nr:hypothetical protein [Iamia sp.]
MTAPTDTRPDEAFEGQVRAMLARRAADVPDRDGTATLPTGLLIPIDDRPSAARRRTRWLAVAVIVLVLGGAALVARAGDGDTTDTTRTTDGPTTTAPPRPGHLFHLPTGIDPTRGPVLGVAPAVATPEQAADALMAATFGEDVTPSAPFGFEGQVEGEGWAAYRTPFATLDPVAWPDAVINDLTGTVTARRTDGGWQVVAVASAALDLRDVTRTADGLTGEVRATSAAPLRVTISTPGGDRLGTVDLTTRADSGHATSVLSLDDLELTLGTGPVVLRVEAGDRPGQVGLDGVGVATLSMVVLPAPAGADDQPAPAATTEPGAAGVDATTASTTVPVTASSTPAVVEGLPAGLDVDDLVPLWDDPPDGISDGDHLDVAWAYVND